MSPLASDVSRWYSYSPLLYWLAIGMAVLFLLERSAASLFSLPFLLIVHHGAHEAVHGTLVPRGHNFARFLNEWSGVVGYALVGHNFVLMRWSHNCHHAYGRLDPECTIDESLRNLGFLGHTRYYLHVLGASAVMHEIAGYLLPLFPNASNLLDGGGKPSLYRSPFFLVSQTLVGVATLLLLMFGGWYFVLCRLLFLPIWGLGQNVAHYGIKARLEKGMEVAARSYRVNRIIAFCLFGANFYHSEHHAFPGIPGVLLSHPEVLNAFRNRYGFEPNYRDGLLAYVMDGCRQLKGPFGDESGSSWAVTKSG